MTSSCLPISILLLSLPHAHPSLQTCRSGPYVVPYTCLWITCCSLCPEYSATLIHLVNFWLRASSLNPWDAPVGWRLPFRPPTALCASCCHGLTTLHQSCQSCTRVCCCLHLLWAPGQQAHAACPCVLTRGTRTAAVICCVKHFCSPNFPKEMSSSDQRPYTHQFSFLNSSFCAHHLFKTAYSFFLSNLIE